MQLFNPAAAAVSATLQSAYNNGGVGVQAIVLGSGGAGGTTLAVRDAAVPLGLNLFEVTNNADSEEFFGISVAAISIKGGDGAVGGVVNIAGGAASGTAAGGNIVLNPGNGTVSSGFVDVLIDDAVATVSDALRLRKILAGAGAAGEGIAVVFNLDDAASTEVSVARVAATLNDATAGNVNAYVSVSAILNGTLTEVARIGAPTAAAATGSILGPDGTALLPAFSFISDPDTGMYSVGANQLGFAGLSQFDGIVTFNNATRAFATIASQESATATGGAAAIPALAVGFITIRDSGGVDRKFAYFDV
jgi:hypothetical protein